MLDRGYPPQRGGSNYETCRQLCKRGILKPWLEEDDVTPTLKFRVGSDYQTWVPLGRQILQGVHSNVGLVVQAS